MSKENYSQWTEACKYSKDIDFASDFFRSNQGRLVSQMVMSKKLSQNDLMLNDMCITVDEQDNIRGYGTKKACHIFSQEQPEGILHRAFSVFLFDDQNRLLLQQRASGKITFPDMWTNTCCSHQLYGIEPDEKDDPKDVLEGKVNGSKIAAIRKLDHELGIDKQQLKPENFKFLTRLHYCAPDVSSENGRSLQQQLQQTLKDKDWVWGEHEMDYILVIKQNVKVHFNQEEIQATKYVTQQELEQMMQPQNGLKWSPWFRIIAKNFLPQWWQNLDSTLNSDKFDDFQSIHKLSVD